MAFGRKSKKGMSAISTASLPDIVFMLLFFFMVVTVMRETELQVEVELPQASELTRLEKKHLVDYINIGPPVDKDRYGSEPKIQLDDQFAAVGDIQAWVMACRDAVEEVEIPKLTTSLKVDVDTKMGVVSAVKQELRQVSALKLNYSSTQRARTGSE